MSAVRIPSLHHSLKRKAHAVCDERALASAIYMHLRDAHVQESDKALIRELGKELSVNEVAEKFEFDIVLTAAIIAGIV